MIDNVTDAIATSPLAVVWLKDKSEVYLYYSTLVRGEHKLRRVVRDANGNWGSPAFPDKAPVIAKATQMTVTSTTEGCHLFYEGTAGKGGFQHYIDKH